MKDIKNLIKDLVTPSGVSGDEKKAADVAIKYLEKYGKIEVDQIGNVICIINPYKDNGTNLLLDAHIDEIGFAVTGITEDGFLKVAEIGGLDTRVLTASEVLVSSLKKEYYGIITSKPPHLSTPEDYKKAVPVKDLTIDVGMDKKTTEKNISIGDRIVLKGDYKETINGRIIAKALDDRLGCAIVIEVAKHLKDNKLNIGLAVLLSTQEEIGVRGAGVAAFSLNPTHAIVVDGTFGDTEFYPNEVTFKLGEGPAIAVGPILNQDMVEDIVKIAKANDIPHGFEVTARNTGTNADSISLQRKGIKTVCISPPIKNLHSTAEMCDIKDVNYSIKLISEYIKYLSDQEVIKK